MPHPTGPPRWSSWRPASRPTRRARPRQAADETGDRTRGRRGKMGESPADRQFPFTDAAEHGRPLEVPVERFYAEASICQGLEGGALTAETVVDGRLPEMMSMGGARQLRRRVGRVPRPPEVGPSRARGLATPSRNPLPPRLLSEVSGSRVASTEGAAPTPLGRTRRSINEPTRPGGRRRNAQRARCEVRRCRHPSARTGCEAA